MVVSKSEIGQVCITPNEGVMLAKCLDDSGDPFFAGYNNLIITIGNLARVPGNRKVFWDLGVIEKLNEILVALLNMISEDERSMIGDLDMHIKVLLNSDAPFMERLRCFDSEVSSGLHLLLSSSDSGNECKKIYLLYHYECTSISYYCGSHCVSL